MPLPQLDTDVNIIQSLDDEPNDVTGLTPPQAKAKFDEAANIIKDYINQQLVPNAATLLDLQNLILGQFPNGIVTDDMLSNAAGMVKAQLADNTTKLNNLEILYWMGVI